MEETICNLKNHSPTKKKIVVGITSLDSISQKMIPVIPDNIQNDSISQNINVLTTKWTKTAGGILTSTSERLGLGDDHISG